MFKGVISILMLALAGLAMQPASAEQQQMTADEFLASLKFQTGKIDLPNNIASIDLPSGFRYLNPDDANRVLVTAWGNPPGDKTLGMIIPSDVSPVSEDSWGVIITYDEEGHVKDDDADKINYADLLKDMQSALQDANEERKKQGYEAISLVGWAEQPSYDKSSHKLYWAKELAFGDDKNHTLNYNIRVLGRKGVLVMNAVAGMNQIAMIKTEMPKVLAVTEFKTGNAYGDFDSSTDKVAEYGIAALVAGAAATKLGLFAKLFAMLLAFKKAVLIGLAAIGAAVAKFFGKGKKAQAENAE